MCGNCINKSRILTNTNEIDIVFYIKKLHNYEIIGV